LAACAFGFDTINPLTKTCDVVLAKPARLLTVFALVASIGGHWAFLQTVAWLGMVVSYSQEATLGAALEKTFDGKHPCSLCRVVQAGKQKEHKDVSLKVETKLDFWLTRAASALDSPPRFVVLPAGPDSVEPRSESPPKPPPRLA
jgi:hypothetical protein